MRRKRGEKDGEEGREGAEGEGDNEGDDDGTEDREMEEEIRAYDRKVHRAYGEMVKATRDELRRMGIPFFEIAAEGNGEGVVGKEEIGEGKLGEEDLEKLRVRMLEFLEDMVRE